LFFSRHSFDLFAPVEALLNGKLLSDGGGTGAKLSLGGDEVLWTWGSGLAFDADGYLIAGTVTLMQFNLGNAPIMQISVSGLDVAAARLAPVGTYPLAEDPSLTYNAMDMDTSDGLGGVSVTGTANSDYLTGSGEADKLVGLEARDTINGSWGADTILGGGGNDWLEGGQGRDIIDGAEGNDLIRGGIHDDRLIGGVGRDTLSGGDGWFDVADYSDKNERVQVELNGSSFVSVKVGGIAEDRIKETEGIIGSSRADRLTGDKWRNIFAGGEGNDKLSGGKGADILSGMGGKDTLTGGADKDKFVFAHTGALNADRITDYESEDGIVLYNSVFAKLTLGLLATANFHIGAEAVDKNDYVIYDDTTGELFYDKDGTGRKDAVLVAIFDDRPDLSAHDFKVVEATANNAYWFV
jgi:Ca2+-binding RTX toxin-like protein